MFNVHLRSHSETSWKCHTHTGSSASVQAWSEDQHHQCHRHYCHRVIYGTIPPPPDLGAAAGMGYLLLLRELGEQVKAAALRVATWYRARCQKGASQRGTTSRVCRPTNASQSAQHTAKGQGLESRGTGQGCGEANWLVGLMAGHQQGSPGWSCVVSRSTDT